VQRKTKHFRRDVKNLCKGNTKRTTTLINRGALIKTNTPIETTNTTATNKTNNNNLSSSNGNNSAIIYHSRFGFNCVVVFCRKSISFQMYKVNLKCVCVCVCVCVCATNYLRGWGVLTLSLVEQTGLLLFCVSFCNMTFS